MPRIGSIFDRMGSLFNRLSAKGEEAWAEMAAARAARRAIVPADEALRGVKPGPQMVSNESAAPPLPPLNLGSLGATAVGGAVLGGGLVEYLNTRKHGRPNDELYTQQL